MALQRSSSSDWTISDPFGGRFLVDFDPIFSADERHLLLATRQCLNVYELSTSLLVRSIQIPERITSIELSKIDDDLIYIADEAGSVNLWNWKDGVQEKSFAYSHKDSLAGKELSIVALSVATVSEDKENLFLAVKYHGSPEEPEISIISVTRETGVPTDQNGKKIQTLSGHLCGLQAIGGAVFVFTSMAVDIGTSIGNKRKREEGINGVGSNHYNWRRLNFGESIHSFDILMHSLDDKSESYQLDMVIGNRVGEISVFEDVLDAQFNRMPQPYHWHRGPVNSVKWSSDGVRIISGGEETVLLIFTRSTGRKDTIPHLTAGILSLSISSSGKFYALHLGNNSVLVLSTSDNKATAAVIGLQSPLLHSRLPTVITPQIPGQILLTVPANSAPQLATGQSPFLQTFDVSTGRHVSRHTIARANVTNVNIAPRGGEKLKESDVTLLQISHDGEWLATVDQWTPPISDLRYTGLDDASLAREQKSRTEVELKFWRWEPNASGGEWQLETKILRPHHHDMILSANKVLDLMASPTKLEFATVGEDGIVRIWKLKKFNRSNSTQKREIYTWILSKQIILEGKLNASSAEWTAPLMPSDGRLAYSNDGSALAAALDYKRQDPEVWMSVSNIDIKSGIVVRIVHGLFTASTLAAMKFLGRYLILVSTLVRVHNIVTDQKLYDYVFEDWAGSKSLKPEQKHAIRNFRQLNVNLRSNTFAVSSIASEDPSKSGEVLVFSFDSDHPIFSVQVSTAITALLSLPASSGYLAIDAAACYHIVRPKGEIITFGNEGIQTLTLESQTINGRANHDEMEVDDRLAITGAEDEDYSESEDEENDEHYKPPVTEEVIDLLERMRLGAGFTNPSDLLAEVAKLYIGKEPSKQKEKSQD